MSLFSAGAQAVLDATPIAPFLEATLVDLAPKAVAGYAIAARIGFGADWAFLPAWALGLAITASTKAEYIQAMKSVEHFASFHFPSEIEEAKKQALILVEQWDHEFIRAVFETHVVGDQS